MDKLNRIDYKEPESEQAAEEIVAQETAVVEEEPEEEELILVSEEEMSALGISEAQLTDMDIFSDNDVFNVLLLGTDERRHNFATNARADSIMILSIDKENKDMKLVSIQRGMGVPILEGQYKGQYDWITHCFRYGGAELMLKEIRECLRVDVDRYVRVNFDSFAEIIDAVGGVDIELTALEAQGLNGEVRTNAYAKHKMYEGVNHLDGYDALQYSRLRYIDSDWKRIQRQRNVIQAVVHKAQGLSLIELNDVANTILPLINTNLTKTEILDLVLFAPNIIGADIEQMSIPQKGTYGGMIGMGGRNLYAVDFEANATILREFLYEE
jgi:LCP family protein required for cell wall assembly